MPVVVVMGAQWGDEGKGKIVDMLAQKADFVVRYNGGNNAGHTVVNEYGEFALHLMPSGIFYPEVTCILGNGVVVNPKGLIAEIEEIRKTGLNIDGRLKISGLAHLVMPWHLTRDAAQEKSRGANKIGTTLRGIGPAMTDKTSRNGIRTAELLDKDSFVKKFRLAFLENHILLNALLNTKNPRTNARQRESLLKEYLYYGELLKPYIDNTHLLLQKAVESQKYIILEGAQGAMLDIDFGTYPYVTSSGCGSASASQGSGIPPNKITRVIGVTKAYTTRVGAGPFPTEMDMGMSDALREKGGEYGRTTGRPRRCGWLDLVSLNEAIEINGINVLALTKLDVLSSFGPLLVRTSSGNAGTNNYKTLNGWREELQNISEFKDLPKAAKEYIRFIERTTGITVKYISVGPDRNQTIKG